MKLYYVWWEDSTSTTDRYEQRQNLVHDAGYGGGDDGDGDGNGGLGSMCSSSHQKGKGVGKGNGKNGGKGRGKGGHPPPTPTPKVPKEKKPKTPNQLARAVSCFNLKWNQDGLKSWMNILALNCGCEIPLVDNVLVPHEIVYI